jgi:hypothetical protein
MKQLDRSYQCCWHHPATYLSSATYACRTFAYEVSASGQRIFIVSSAELFWQHYKALPPAERHHYEIIRQASPCHLYFGEPGATKLSNEPQNMPTHVQ